MAEFTHIELRAARESRKTPRWKLAGEIGVSEDTLERWETGKQLPGPDDVGNIERVLNIPGIWHGWMMSHYDSYRERNTAVPDLESLLADVIRTKHEMSDAVRMFDEIERDAVDGIINKPEMWREFFKELMEAKAAIQQIIDRIPKENR